MAFGYVIDFACPPKDALGGTLKAATQLAFGKTLAVDEGACLPCKIVDAGGIGCIGVLLTPISESAEQFLGALLPESIETPAGEMLKLATAAGATGARGKALREAGKLAGKEPLKRAWGALGKRFALSTDHLVDALFCVGDIEPPHALALLVALGAMEVDGARLERMEQCAVLPELIEGPGNRKRRTRCLVEPIAGDEPGVLEVKQFLRALYASFCLDRKLFVFEGGT